MNGLDAQYQSLLSDIVKNGLYKKTRNGETLSVFGRQIRHKMNEGFPLLTTKKMAWKQIVTELLWFLRGDTNIKYLVDNDCHIWDGDAFKKFMQESEGDPDLIWNQDQFIEKIKTDDEFAKTWGELGPIYGAQWRKWDGIDQIQNLIDELKSNPDSRRMLVSAWNVNYLDEMTLPPCHYGFQVYTRELSFEERWDLSEKYGYRKNGGEMPTETETFNGVNARIEFNSMMNDFVIGTNLPTRAISLMFNMRSNDVPLGLPFNLASYGLLLEIIAKQVNMVPDELITNMGDCHIYLNQIDGVNEQLTREPYELPTVKISDKIVNDISEYEIGDFILENYQYHPTIKMPLSN